MELSELAWALNLGELKVRGDKVRYPLNAMLFFAVCDFMVTYY